jgi:hypothetical protein
MCAPRVTREHGQMRATPDLGRRIAGKIKGTLHDYERGVEPQRIRHCEFLKLAMGD